MEKAFLLTTGQLQTPVKVTASDFGIRRVVLGVHGLGGSAQDEIQSNLAEEMEFFDSAVYRFDFPSHGENPMSGRDFSLKNCRDTLMAVANRAKADYPEVEDLCIFATGFGAYVVLTCLEELMDLPGRVKLVVQTPSVRMDETILAMRHISKATFQAMDKVSFNSKRPFDVYYSFYEECHENLVMMTFPMPMLILHGEQDSYINREDIQSFAQLNDQSKLVIIPGASHRFLEEGAWDMVLDLTRDWFEFEQVLLSDWS